MKIKKAKEYQTLHLFATLGFLTLLIVLLFKVVLFAPQTDDKLRAPAAQLVEPSKAGQSVLPQFFNLNQ